VEITSYIANMTSLAVNTYHVNPNIFLLIYIISIPIFYIAIYFIAKELMAIKKEHGKITAKHFLYEEALSFWMIVLLLDYLAPYLYIAIFGENLPTWVWAVIIIVVSLSIFSLFNRFIKTGRTKKHAEK